LHLSLIKILSAYDGPHGIYVVMNENENSLLRINALKIIVPIDQLILHENTSAAFLFGRGSAGRVFGEKLRGRFTSSEMAIQLSEASTCDRAVSTFVCNLHERTFVTLPQT
jgi:hypothetical protein